MIRRINELSLEQMAAGRRVGVIATDETKNRYHADSVLDIGSRSDDEAIARHLFRVLRTFDDEGMDVLYTESFDTPRMGMAIMNRLLKSAGHQVIRADENG